jgi:NAD(P)H dehydrogenase (quinone)
MNVLIVHAHPEPQSFTTSMMRTATETLRAAGHTVQVSDLYAMNWNPIASAADFNERSNPDYLVYALEQRENNLKNALTPDIATEIEKLKWCDLLILSFPIFWFSVPAIMKGWIDRVLVSGYCYGGTRFYDKGGLRGKKAMLAYTLGGQPHMFGPGAVHGEMELMLRPLVRGTLGYVGFDILPPFVAWHVPYISQEERVGFLDRYKLHLENVENLPALVPPSLAGFDKQMRPIRHTDADAQL